MINLKETFQEGPSFENIVKCEGCKYLISKDSLKSSTFVRSNTCSKLDKDFNSSSNIITPHFDCPFLKQNTLKFYESQVKKLKEDLSLKLKTELTSIFPEYWEYEDYLFKKIDVEISAAFKIDQINYSQLIDFQRCLPDYELSFDACTRDKILVKVYKKMECF